MKVSSFFALHSQRKFLLLTALFILAVSTHGQTNAPAPQAATVVKPLAYEVVSVKPSPSGGGKQIATRPDRFTGRNITLWDLLYNAYDVKPNDPFAGLPGWANSAEFDVEAKMDEDTYAALQKLPGQQQYEQRQVMLQAILADRFRLRIHHEISERPIYALVVARSGVKLKEAPADEKPRGISWGGGQINMHPAPISRLAFTLSDVLDRNVVDKTGLTGSYDIALKWTPDELQGTADAGPTLFTALEEQLGLKLVPSKGPVDTIVVDHVERPTVD